MANANASRYWYVGFYKHISYWFVAKQLFGKRVGKKNLILDAGCGKGDSSPLIPEGAEVVGIDISRSNADICKNRWQKNNYIVGDLTRLPFCDATFEGILSVDVVEHIKDKNSAFTELYRVTKKDGFFIGCSSNILNPILWLDVKVPNLIKPLVNKFAGVGHYDRHCRFSPHSLNKTLVNAGYSLDSFVMTGSALFDCRHGKQTFLMYLWIIFDKVTNKAPLIYLKEEFVWLCTKNKT